jgi:Zn-dependent alcohol dehydrogenase
MNVPRSMKAAILVGQHRDLVVDEVELPARLEHGQALVRVHYSGLCGSQVGEIDGVKGADPHLPHLLGHEGSATVLAVGPGVRRFGVGDRVVLHWRKAAGIESPTPAYRWRGQPLNAGWVTTLNEYAVVSENRATPIDAGADAESAVLLGCAATTGLGVVANDACVRIGESVVVLGCGGVGSFVVQGAAMTSAHPVVAVDRTQAKLELARRLGATHVVDANGGDVERHVADVLRAGADVVVETTGRAELIEAAYRMCAPQGRVVLVGVPRADERARIDTLALHFGKRLIGSHGGAAAPDTDIPRYLALHRAGKLALDDVVTERVKLDDVNTAIARLRAGEVTGRCVVEISAPV